MEKEKDAPRKEEKEAQAKEVQIDGSEYCFKENLLVFTFILTSQG